MNVAPLPAALPGAVATQPAGPARDAAAAADAAVATFAATLDRSRHAIAIAKDAHEPSLPGVPGRKKHQEHGGGPDADASGPDALALLLASAAIAAPPPATAPRVVAAGLRSATPRDAADEAALPETGPRGLEPSGAFPAADAAQHTDPRESIAHERFALTAAPADAGHAAAADRAVAPGPAPAAILALAPSGTHSPQLVVDAAAGPTGARPFGAESAAHGRPLSMPPAVAADAAPPGSAADAAAAAPLSAAAIAADAASEARERRPASPADGAGTLAAMGTAPASAPAADPQATFASGVVSPPVGSSEWAPALAQQVAHLGRRGSEIQLDLHPAELGPLTVKLSLGDSQAQVMFLSEHAAVRQALEAALPQLRATLADSGISLGQATVGSGTNGGGQPAMAQGGGDGGARRQPAPEPAGTARVAATSPAFAAPARAGLDTFA